jgi:hypothetical protein
MKKIELVETTKQPLPQKGEFLWRYFDIHKFLFFLHAHTLRFSRMDQFEDPLEGIPLSALTTYAKKLNMNLIQDISLSELVVNPRLLKMVPPALQVKLNAIHGIQKSTFVICFFYEERESMAMWNLYSNADGVAIKMPFGKLATQLKVDEQELPLSAFYGGRVSYQNFKTIDPFSENEQDKVPKVALRKDSSFSHEQEFRFVLRTHADNSEMTGIDSLPLDIHKLGLKVVCHPRMNSWKKANIRSLLESHGLKNAFEESEILLRSNG